MADHLKLVPTLLAPAPLTAAIGIAKALSALEVIAHGMDLTKVRIALEAARAVAEDEAATQAEAALRGEW